MKTLDRCRWLLHDLRDASPEVLREIEQALETVERRHGLSSRVIFGVDAEPEYH